MTKHPEPTKRNDLISNNRNSRYVTMNTVLSGSQQRLVRYWGEQKTSLVNSISEVGKISPYYRRSLPWLCKFIDTLISTKPQLSSENRKILLDYLDLVSRTDIDEEPRLRIEKRITGRSDYYIKALNSKERTRENLRALRELKRNLKLKAIELKANELLSEGKISDFNSLQRRHRTHYISDISIKVHHPSILDLSSCTFDNVNFEDLDASKYKFRDVNFKDCQLNSNNGYINFLNFYDCNFDNCKFNGEDLNTALGKYAAELLKSGDIAEFNALRRIHKINFHIKGITIKKDLTEAINLSDCILENVQFETKNFSKQNLSNTKFINCSFDSVRLSNNKFSNCKFEGCQFKSSIISATDFYDSELLRCRLNDNQILQSQLNQTNFTDCRINQLEGHPVKNKNNSLIDNSNFTNCQLQNSDLQNLKLARSKFIDCQFERVDLITCFLKQVEFLRTQFKKVVFDYGNPETQAIQLLECNPRGYEFKNQDKDLEAILARIEFLNRFRELDSPAQRKFLLEHPDEAEDISRSELIKIFGISNKTLNQIDTSIVRSNNDPETHGTLIQRLALIRKIKDTTQSLVPISTREKIHVALCKLLYQSACTPSAKQKTQTQSIADEFNYLKKFTEGDFTEIKDSIDEAIDYLLIPRIKALHPNIDIKKFNGKNLDQITRYMQPYLAYAIIAPRDFERLPKSASYKGLSLLLNFSKDFHDQHTNFTGSVRDFAPQGGWRPILDKPTIEITGSDGRVYELENLLTAADFKKESEELGHCIGDSMTYVNRAKKGSYHYFSIRDQETKKRISTLELHLVPFTNKTDQVRILDTNFAFVSLQNQGSTRNYRDPGIGAEIEKKFLAQVQMGTTGIKTTNLEFLGDLNQKTKITNYENHIGTRLETDEKSGMHNLRRIQRKAWARLARLDDFYLDRGFGNLGSSATVPFDELNPKLEYAHRQAQVLHFMRARVKQYDTQAIEQQSQLVTQAYEEVNRLIELREKTMPMAHEVIGTVRSTAGIGSYSQSAGSPYDNYFIPNCFRGSYEGDSFIEFSDPEDPDRDGIDIGLEKFYTEKIPGLDISLDTALNQALKHYKLLAI